MSIRRIGSWRWVPRIVAAVLVTTAVAQCSGASGSAAAVSTPPCTTAGLVVWISTVGNGAAGSSYYPLRFTNLSGHTCSLAGYPGVSAVTLAGAELGAAAREDAVAPRAVVTLRSGVTASSDLQITDAGNFPAATCREVTAAGLRVYPPGQRASKIVPFPFPTCSSAKVDGLGVEVVQRS